VRAKTRITLGKPATGMKSRVSWQTRWSYLAIVPLASSIGYMAASLSNASRASSDMPNTRDKSCRETPAISAGVALRSQSRKRLPSLPRVSRKSSRNSEAASRILDSSSLCLSVMSGKHRVDAGSLKSFPASTVRFDFNQCHRARPPFV